MNNNYKKYIKYKNKYLNSIQQRGGYFFFSKFMESSYSHHPKRIIINDSSIKIPDCEDKNKNRIYIYNDENTSPIKYCLNILNKYKFNKIFYMGGQNENKECIGNFIDEEYVIYDHMGEKNESWYLIFETNNTIKKILYDKRENDKPVEDLSEIYNLFYIEEINN